MSQPQRSLHVVRGGELVPPCDLDAEAAVLSAVMLDPAAMPKVRDFLRFEHFFGEAHRRIFEACEDLFAKREPIDTSTVGSWLRARDRLAQVGGMPYIGSILDSSPVVANVRSHALAVHAMWRRRRIALTCKQAELRAHGEIDDVQAFCDGIVRSLAVVGANNPLKPVESNHEALRALVSDAVGKQPDETARATDEYGFPTGLHSLDRIFWGFRPGAKTTVAATTGVGKTAFALQCALRVAGAGAGVLFFSTELKRRELLRRALAAEACVPSEKIKRRTLEPLEVSAVVEAGRRLAALPMHIDETARLTVEQLRASTMAFAEQTQVVTRRPLGLVVVDYVQRLATSSSMYSRKPHEQIEHATTELKIMAQELGCAVMELAQALDDGGGPKKRKRQRPTAENSIAGSKRIAKESDEVLFLWPLEHDDSKSDQDVEIIVAKQRDGRKGSAEVVFHRDISTFEDMNDPMRCASRDYLDTLLGGPG